jgi:glucose-1-phosphate adenylyltransferase
VIENSIIGVRSRIGSNCTIRNSIVMGSDFFQPSEEIAADLAAGRPYLGIGDGTRIDGAIVDKNCRIGANVRICNESKVDSFPEAGGAMIVDGIVCIEKEAVLPNGWRLENK